MRDSSANPDIGATTATARVVFPLHGIRTEARWRDAFHGVAVNRGWKVRLAAWYFGKFSILFFLFAPARAAKLRWFRDTYSREMKSTDVGLKDGELPSIIAHSFGTYILGHALLRYPFLRFNKILLCGSILPQDFSWVALIRHGQVHAVRNEYGVRDTWAAMVRWFVRGSGPSGVKGFHQLPTDGFEQEEFLYPHSDYFSEGHMERYWLTFLERPSTSRPLVEGRVSQLPRETAPWGLYALGMLFLAAFVFIAALALPIRSQSTRAAQEDPAEVAEFQRLAAYAAVVDVQPCPTPSGEVDILVTGVNVQRYKDRIKVFVDGKPTWFDEPSSGDGKIARVKIPPATQGQRFASLRVQVGPVMLQGERQCRYQ